jgi:hypothetical protein
MKKIVPLVCCAVAATVLGASPAASAATTEHGEPSAAQTSSTKPGKPAAQPGLRPKGGRTEETGVSDVPDDSAGQVSIMAPCTPETRYDFPHMSSTGWAVSAHGSWNHGNCSIHANTAMVRVTLQEYWTDGTWRTYHNPVRELYAWNSGGGRTTARVDCMTSSQTSWRSIVDVDVVGVSDTGDIKISYDDVPCRVW